MATKTNNDMGTQTADTVICKSLQVIKNDKNTAHSAHIAYETLEESKRIARKYVTCCVNKAEESNDVYQSLMSCVTVGNSKKTEIVQTSIDDYIKLDDSIEKLIKDSSKLLKELRDKIEHANNAACALNNCVRSRILPKTTGKKAKMHDPKIVDVENKLLAIVDKSKVLDEKGHNAHESIITIAGIQTFTNTTSLKGFATNLNNAMKLFKDCLDANIKSTQQDVETSRTDLNVIIEELATIECSKNSELAKEHGLGKTITYVCEGEYDDGCIDLCKDMENCFEPIECIDGHPVRKTSKQSANKN